jgi:hypothetical protein
MFPRPAKAADQSQTADAATSPSKWVRNGALAKHFTVSAMCVWRWKRDAKLNCPPSYLVNGIEWNDLNAWDRWMRDRMVSHIDRYRKTKKAQAR